MRSPLRGAASWALLVAALFVTVRARAEARAVSQDVRVVVDGQGVASIAARLGYRVHGVPLKVFDVRGVDGEDGVDGEVTLASEDGALLAAHAEWAGNRIVRVRVDEAAGLKRGTYVLALRYRMNLAARGRLVAEGALARLTFASPEAPDGVDGARIVFQLPPAKTEPRAVRLDGDGPDEALAATLRRTPGFDELELVRAHVARGETPTWALRLDPKVFPSLAPAAPLPEETVDDRQSLRGGGLLGTVAGLFGALVGLLVLGKHREVARLCRRAHSEPRPLVGVLVKTPTVAVTVAVVVGAVGAGLGLALQCLGAPLLGTALGALALGAGVHRTPRSEPRPRGPGQWLALRPEDGFAKSAVTPLFDAGTGRGVALFVGLVLGAFGAALAVSRSAPHLAHFLAMDVLVLVPLFLTGRVVQLAPGPCLAAPFLRRVHRKLAAGSDLRVTPWARLPLGEAEPDEVRLLVLPRLPRTGLSAIEVGVGWAGGPWGFVTSPEILVRVAEGTEAATALAGLAPGVRSVPGRKEGERVFSLRPRWPTVGGAARLASRLGRELSRPVSVPPAPAYRREARRSPVVGRWLKAFRGAQRPPSTPKTA